MKFQVDGHYFQGLLKRAAKVTDEKDDFRRFVELKAENGEIFITASMLGNRMKIKSRAINVEDGVCRIEPKKAANLIDGRHELFTFELGTGMHISCEHNNSQYTVSALDGGFVYEEPDYGQHTSLMLNDSIKFDIRRALTAVSKNQYRPAMEGVCLHVSGGSCNVVSTDSYRLTLSKMEMKHNDMQHIINPKAAELIAEMEGETTLEISEDGKYGKACNGIETVEFQFITERFPAYESVLPESNLYCTVDKSELIRTTKMAQVSGGDKTLKLIFKENGIFTESHEANEESDQGFMFSNSGIQCEYAGPAMTVGFNTQYLIEALNTLAGDLAVIGLIAPDKPVVIQEHAEDGKEFKHLVMPVRIDKEEVESN